MATHKEGFGRPGNTQSSQPTQAPNNNVGARSAKVARVGKLGKKMHGAGGTTGYPKA